MVMGAIGIHLDVLSRTWKLEIHMDVCGVNRALRLALSRPLPFVVGLLTVGIMGLPKAR
jgi:hypothetical protein